VVDSVPPWWARPFSEKTGKPLRLESVELDRRVQKPDATLCARSPANIDSWFKANTTTPHHSIGQLTDMPNRIRWGGGEATFVPEQAKHHTVGQQGSALQSTLAGAQGGSYRVHPFDQGRPILLYTSGREGEVKAQDADRLRRVVDGEARCANPLRRGGGPREVKN
jgi:hypothetical protein